jgi:hypothetical protein
MDIIIYIIIGILVIGAGIYTIVHKKKTFTNNEQEENNEQDVEPIEVETTDEVVEETTELESVEDKDIVAVDEEPIVEEVKELSEAEKKVIELQNAIKVEEDKQKKFLNDNFKKIQNFVYDFSNETPKGSICHLFHYKNLYTLALWQYDDDFEVSIHSMNKKGVVLVNKNYIGEELHRKLLTETLLNLGKFITRIKLDGHNKDNSYKQGTLEGYRSGYIAGYLRGQEQYLKNEFGIPDDDTMLQDLARASEKLKK